MKVPRHHGASCLSEVFCFSYMFFGFCCLQLHFVHSLFVIMMCFCNSFCDSLLQGSSILVFACFCFPNVQTVDLPFFLQCLLST